MDREREAAGPVRERRLLRFAAPLVSAALFFVALREIAAQLRGVHYHELLRAAAAIPHQRLAAAAAFACVSYLALTLYDTLGLRYCRRRVAYRRTAFASFVCSALNNSVGFSGIAGASLRFRLYCAWGVPAEEVASLIAFSASTFWLGFLTLAGLALATHPAALANVAWASTAARPAGLLLLSVPVLYLALVLVRQRPFKVLRWSFRLPALRIAIGQVCVSVVDWAAVAASLHVLLPGAGLATYGATLSAYCIAQFAGVLSNLPGGVGVFDALLIALLAGRYPGGGIVAALVMFRAVYYLAPLALAALLIAARELVEGRRALVAAGSGIARAGKLFVPEILSLAVFLCGGMLLLSGATPAKGVRMEALRLAIPLPLLELSHIASTISGAGLLLVARGVQRRLDGAYWLALWLAGGGVVFSLLKGLDYEEAFVLLALGLALLPFRAEFYRRTRLMNEPFSGPWLLAIAMTLTSVFWIGLFAYRRVEYEHELWWHFSFHAGDAPRFLRSGAAAAVVVVVFAARRLLAASRSARAAASPASIDAAASIVSRSNVPSAPLALLGDKELIFSEDRSAFLMYRRQGRSWVAMGDPVGPPAAAADLAWRFVEDVDRHDGWPVFYQVHREHLSLYADMGLVLSKLGEEARVDLASFTLSGNARKALRHTWRRLSDRGLTLEIVQGEEVTALLPQLREVSDRWLETRNAREKSFSLGAFSEEYVARFRVALVRDSSRILAFANLWELPAAGEFSVDLMRYLPDAPQGVMDFLLVSLMIHGPREGYRWFNLGMAPLAGVHRRAGAALWPRIAALGFEHANRFYNFQGLRQFKAKFDPVWEPVYMASPGGLKLAAIFADLAVLIGGGVRGVLAR